jgi:4-hydroxybenzoate polyprenyltransferase
MVYSKTIEDTWSLELKKKIKGLTKLIMLDESIYFVLINALLGVLFAQVSSNPDSFLVVIAHCLVMSFYKIYKYIKRAPDDALSGNYSTQNPIAAGLISLQTARIVFWIIGLLAISVFIFLGIWPLIFGLIALTSVYLLSTRDISTDRTVFPNQIPHRIILAGAQFLSGYLSLTSSFSKIWYWGLIFVLAINVASILTQQYRPAELKRRNLIRGQGEDSREKGVHILMMTTIVIAVFSGVVIFITIELFPVWSILLFSTLAVVFIILRFFKMNQEKKDFANQSIFQNSLEKAGAFSLVLYLLIPWVDQFFSLGIF